jgi:hypothetical protein
MISVSGTPQQFEAVQAQGSNSVRNRLNTTGPMLPLYFCWLLFSHLESELAEYFPDIF